MFILFMIACSFTPEQLDGFIDIKPSTTMPIGTKCWLAVREEGTTICLFPDDTIVTIETDEISHAGALGY